MRNASASAKCLVTCEEEDEDVGIRGVGHGLAGHPPSRCPTAAADRASPARDDGRVRMVYARSMPSLPPARHPPNDDLVARARSRRMRSVARFRAVLISQARGWLGMPSRGHRSAAMANASCAASSARSKSPRKPIRAARTRPHSSRKMRSSVATNTPRRVESRRRHHSAPPGRGWPPRWPRRGRRPRG